jgi:hypothetical protein
MGGRGGVSGGRSNLLNLARVGSSANERADSIVPDQW